MTSLVSIFGGPFIANANETPIEEQLARAMFNAGIVTPPKSIQFDGQLHRFSSGTTGSSFEKKHGPTDKPGWYVAFSDGVPSGKFGCYRADISQKWRAETSVPLSINENLTFERRMSEAKRIRQEELERHREIAIETIDTIWSSGALALETHKYLERKKKCQPL
jgi:putative DNA primase/helicase